jgi:hypothetical protein
MLPKSTMSVSDTTTTMKRVGFVTLGTVMFIAMNCFSIIGGEFVEPGQFGVMKTKVTVLPQWRWEIDNIVSSIKRYVDNNIFVYIYKYSHSASHSRSERPTNLESISAKTVRIRICN